jgi:dihydropyrimidinase
MLTLIQHGTLVTAADTATADILIDGERIAQIGIDLRVDNARSIDATDLLVMPGGVDVHTHLELPVSGTVSSDDFFTGQRAAAFGGTTTHIDFAIQPQGGSLHGGIAQWHDKAQSKACIDYGFHANVTNFHDDLLRELPALVNEGITSIKLLMAYKGAVQTDDVGLFKTLRAAGECGMLTMVHCEHGDVIELLVKEAIAQGHIAPRYHYLTRPAWCESEATSRAIALAAIAHAPLYIVHMTCEGALNQLSLALQHGLSVWGETCPHYLCLTQDALDTSDFSGAKFVCSPPLRTPHDQQALWSALSSGLLSVVATDHCPFFFDGQNLTGLHAARLSGLPPITIGKERGRDNFSLIPNGVPGIEERLMILWHVGVNGGRISANRFVELTATKPAQLFGLYPRKGTIAVDSDADLVLWDAQQTHVIGVETQHTRTDYNLFEGKQVQGKPRKVFLRGQLIVDGDQWLGAAGQGRFIKRSVSSVT